MADSIMIRSSPPLFFEIVRRWIAADLKGGWRLAGLLDALHRRFGILDQAAWFDVEGGKIAAPLHWPQLIAKDRLARYETTQISQLAALVEASGRGWLMVDCGADIGLFSRRLLDRTTRIERVVALEMNPKSYALLVANLARCGVLATPMNVAVSDYLGRAGMVQPAYYDSDHAKHIERGGDGTQVVTIDSLGLPADLGLLLKIDVEGEELAALRGAEQSLRRAPDFIVQIEANADVIRRNGVDAVECLRFLQAIRPVRCIVLHDSKVLGDTLDVDRPFFDQYPGFKSCDVVMLPR